MFETETVAPFLFRKLKRGHGSHCLQSLVATPRFPSLSYSYDAFCVELINTCVRFESYYVYYIYQNQ